MSIHQSVDAPGVLRGEEKSESFFETIPKSELVFSITDQGDAKDLSSSSPPDVVDVAPEVVRRFFSVFHIIIFESVELEHDPYFAL